VQNNNNIMGEPLAVGRPLWPLAQIKQVALFMVRSPAATETVLAAFWLAGWLETGRKAGKKRATIWSDSARLYLIIAR